MQYLYYYRRYLFNPPTPQGSNGGGHRIKNTYTHSDIKFVNYYMRNIFLILIIPVFLIAEDEYPFFSDIEKQLEFEERRIVIKEVDHVLIQSWDVTLSIIVPPKCYSLAITSQKHCVTQPCSSHQKRIIIISQIMLEAGCSERYLRCLQAEGLLAITERP